MLRAQRRKKCLDIGATIVNTIHQRLDDDRRVSKAMWKSLEKTMKRSYRLPPDTKAALVEVLRGHFTVVVARGEADVYIARQQQANMVAVSGDSDLVFHTNVRLLARVVMQHGLPVFVLVHRDEVLKELGLTDSISNMYHTIIYAINVFVF